MKSMPAAMPPSGDALREPAVARAPPPGAWPAWTSRRPRSAAAAARAAGAGRGPRTASRAPWWRRELVGQRGPHGVDGLVEQPAAVGERHLEGVELALHVPGADAEDRPPAGQRVERRPGLGHHERVAVRQHVDVAEQPDPLGDRGQVRQRGDGVPPRGAHRLRLGGRHRDVVAHGDVVEPGGLAGLGDLHQLGRAGRRLPRLHEDGALRLDRQLHAEGDHRSPSSVENENVF